MSKKETLIEFFHNIGIDYYDNATQVHSVMEQYAQSKVLEALTNKDLQCSKECELVKCQDLHDKNKELQKENKHLKQVYEHRCNEVKDKVETIHNYLNEITLLKKEIESLTNKKEG